LEGGEVRSTSASAADGEVARAKGVKDEGEEGKGKYAREVVMRDVRHELGEQADAGSWGTRAFRRENGEWCFVRERECSGTTPRMGVRTQRPE
jgi:hypothetical protein